jgi:hypothetical protein
VLNGRDALTGRKTYLQKSVHGTKRVAETELARFVAEVGDGAHASTNRPRYESGRLTEPLADSMDSLRGHRQRRR